SRKCLLHYFSGMKLFTKDSCKCSDKIEGKLRQCYQVKGEIKLNDLIKLNGEFNDDTKFYQDLYMFIIGIMELLSDKTKFENKEIFNMILKNFKNFVHGSLTFVLAYMNTYHIISGNMI